MNKQLFAIAMLLSVSAVSASSPRAEDRKSPLIGSAAASPKAECPLATAAAGAVVVVVEEDDATDAVNPSFEIPRKKPVAKRSLEEDAAALSLGAEGTPVSEDEETSALPDEDAALFELETANVPVPATTPEEPTEDKENEGQEADL